MTNAFRVLLIRELIRSSVFVFIFLFSLILSAVKPDISATAGVGWKNDLDPVISFRSASDIFKRTDLQKGAVINLSASAGISSEKGEGFYADISLGTLLSLQSMENSTLNTAFNTGYLFSVKKVHLFAFTGSFHNYTVDFKDFRSLFVDPTVNFSYLYDGSDLFSVFLRLGATYYIPTHVSVEYLNGISFFAELGNTFLLHEIFSFDIFTGTSFTFLKDQEITYNRYNDVFYGNLDIAGKYYSIYLGTAGQLEIKNFFIPASVKYTFSRSFNEDIHRMIYWEDLNLTPTVVRKTRTDNIAEISLGLGYSFNDNYDLKATYDFYGDFSNVSGEYGDYADYNRISHMIMLEFEYVY